jgi:hypothetical protein
LGAFLFDWKAWGASSPPGFVLSAMLLKMPGGFLPGPTLLLLLDLDRQLLSTGGPRSTQSLGRLPSLPTNRVSVVLNLTFFLHAARGSLHLFLTFCLDLNKSLMAMSRSLSLSRELSFSPTLRPLSGFPRSPWASLSPTVLVRTGWFLASSSLPGTLLPFPWLGESLMFLAVCVYLFFSSFSYNFIQIHTHGFCSCFGGARDRTQGPC